MTGKRAFYLREQHVGTVLCRTENLAEDGKKTERHQEGTGFYSKILMVFCPSAKAGNHSFHNIK